jgi:hypothetical protein
MMEVARTTRTPTSIRQGAAASQLGIVAIQTVYEELIGAYSPSCFPTALESAGSPTADFLVFPIASSGPSVVCSGVSMLEQRRILDFRQTWLALADLVAPAWSVHTGLQPTAPVEHEQTEVHDADFGLYLADILGQRAVDEPCEEDIRPAMGSLFD